MTFKVNKLTVNSAEIYGNYSDAQGEPGIQFGVYEICFQLRKDSKVQW